MTIDLRAIQERLRNFDFSELFTQELGWDFPPASLSVSIGDHTHALTAVAEKRGLVVYTCSPNAEGDIPPADIRSKIERQVARSIHEHIIIFVDEARARQKWLWVRRRPGGPIRNRTYDYYEGHSGEAIAQRLAGLFITLEEEENLTLPDITSRVSKNLDVETVTRRFYDRFKQEHTAFLDFIEGIATQGDREWYASIMLNRLMFLYFIQKKGFLDKDHDYLRHRLDMVQENRGKNQFHTFYRYFLIRLMHEGLNQLKDRRKPDLDELIGNVPYLNGGIFEEHPLEKQHRDLDIPDAAFERIFDFFDEYRWHLDERPLRNNDEINPDVLGYIFEKYINQKQMGAYYTKEDITDYISKNTILPFLFEAARKTCKAAFVAEAPLWALLRENPDRYIYTAVRCGVIDEDGTVIPLPEEIEAGIDHVSQRDNWNRPATAPYALPTETWREHVARRQRCLDLRRKLADGAIARIDDFITYNLDIRQFVQDVIENCDDPDLLRAFYQAIENVTVLDPTCGSGAFLFAALNILEPLYEACLERMQVFIDELQRTETKPNSQKYSDFRKTLDRVSKHPNRAYFIYKTIILRNLYGVDIMEEATEICKLRLFLKLVSQVEIDDHLEPLPDVDFNIRAGNTLVGFATYDQVKEAVASKFDFDNALPRIEQKAEDIDRLFALFRQQQTELGGEITAEDKRQLRERLKELEAELNRYLAREYGIDAENKKQAKKYQEWLKSHQPFHWFIEFYGIMKDGGFDVIIGNPPYVEYKTIQEKYSILYFETQNCGDLYAFIIERSFILQKKDGSFGMIIPISFVSTDGFSNLRNFLDKYSFTSWIINFAERPSKLFTGVEKRLTICVTRRNLDEYNIKYLSGYHRWLSEERKQLFNNSYYVKDRSHCHIVKNALPKISTETEINILSKLGNKKPLSIFFTKKGKYNILMIPEFSQRACFSTVTTYPS